MNSKKTYSSSNKPLAGQGVRTHTAYSLLDKTLRMLLVFSLAFMLTWHFEYSLAYGAEPNGADTSAEEASSSTAAPVSDPDPDSTPDPEPTPEPDPEPDPDPDPTPDPEPTPEPDPEPDPDPDPQPSSDDNKTKSVAWVKTVEIVKAEGTWDAKKNEKETFGNKEKLTIEIPKEGKATYKFRAKVTYGLDSTNTTTEKPVYSAPDKSLHSQVSGLEDLVWKVYAVDKNDPNKKVDIPKELASIDEKTGVLTISAELSKHEEYTEIHVQAYSKNTRNGVVKDDSGPAMKLDVVVEAADDKKEDKDNKSSEDQEAILVPITINYDANYDTVETTNEEIDESIDEGTGENVANSDDENAPNIPSGGTMQPSHSDAEGKLVIAECEFETPKDKVFGGWNTEKDGSGAPFSPGSTITSVDLTSLVQQTDENAQTDATEDATTSESSSEASSSSESSSSEASSSLEETETEASNSTSAIELTLYAQWVDKKDSSDSEDDGSTIRISYIPAPIGGNAYLSPILADVGQITFYYQWEVSTDGGSTWEYASTDDPQALIVPTTEQTIGYQYRVSAHANKIINPAENSNVVTSEPVTIRAADKDEFLAMLEFDPTEEDENAFFQVSFPNGKDSLESIEWMVSRDYGRNWEPIADAQGESYYVPTIENNLGNWYRVKAVRKGAEDENDPNDPNVAYSNIQMLVALSTEMTQEDIDNYDKERDTPTNDTDPGTNPGNSENTGDNGSSSNPDNNDSSDDFQDTNPVGPTSPDDDSGTPYDDTGSYEPFPEGSSPIPTPAPSAPEYIPIDSITDATDEEAVVPEEPGLNLINDPDISELLSKTQEVDVQPGAHWRKLSVIPQQEEIQEVLESNPFAPFVMPLSIALVACGMIERLVFFRRQKRDSGAAFA